jgi:hypothetical protein
VVEALCRAAVWNAISLAYHMKEKQRRWLLANAMAHKKANKRCSIAAD